MADFIAVSKDEFFGSIGQLDVVLRTEREATFWETRGRTVLGITTPGYMGGGQKTYRIAGHMKEPTLNRTAT